MCLPVRGWRWRDGPQLPLQVPRLRAEGKLLEIGLDDLSLTLEEAVVLLRNAGGATERG